MLGDKIRDVFKDRKGRIIGEYKRYALMILIYREKNGLEIILEKRSSYLKHQPGDICLPGGKIEEGESPCEAAVRECCEELNIKAHDIECIGEMDYLVTPYGAVLYPFVGFIDKIPNKPSASEVERIIRVPMEFLLNTKPETYDMHIGPYDYEDFPFHFIEGGRSYRFSKGIMTEYFYEYEEWVIWGFTAAVIKDFCEVIKKEL